MKQIDIYDLDVSKDYAWPLVVKDRNGYPVDLTGKTITAKVVAFNESIYKYQAAVTNVGVLPLEIDGNTLKVNGIILTVKGDPTDGAMDVTVSAGALSEMTHFIHTYYVMVDDEVEFFGLMRPNQVYHNQLDVSPERVANT